ncbi:transposase [Hyphomicrobiales bacterium]|nr:transposase [Hyphomicrobiales bacterium]CAH1677076.1 transposase [Hyphomicrobiales bacterium]
MEACGSAHYWGRELASLGHDVRLMPEAYVKPYVKRGKNDAVDAEANCEAVTRPTMRFVAIKSAEQQAVLMLHRTRDLLVRQRTMLINSLRGQMAEFSLIAGQGAAKVADLAERIRTAPSSSLPDAAKACAEILLSQITELQVQIRAIEHSIMSCHRASAISQRLETIPGVGIITATAIAATVADARIFESDRHFAAWVGLTPRQSGSGGKVHLGKISKKGESYLRRLLVLGATALVRYARNRPEIALWIGGLLARRPPRVAMVAVANKLARIAWAVMARGEDYRGGAVSVS